MNHVDLFSGVGGFSLGLERAGFKTVAFCEIDPYCQKVLRKHWPNVPIYEDIKTFPDASFKQVGFTGQPWGFDGILTAGFPCQDISCAGKREGIEGKRSGLWSELARVLGELRPRYAILENVSALLSGDRGRWFGRVLGDLAEIGYDCEWHCIPASYLGAPHRRDRVWIVAYPNGREQGRWFKQKREQNKRNSYPARDGSQESVADTPNKRLEGWLGPEVTRQAQRFFASAGEQDGWWQSEPDVGRVADGVPARVDRFRCLGNAIVPQIAELIGRAIRERESAKA